MDDKQSPIYTNLGIIWGEAVPDQPYIYTAPIQKGQLPAT